MLTGIRHTEDFARIAGLPRRTVDAEEARRLAVMLTKEFAVPGSLAAQEGLRMWQGYVLAEFLEFNGVIGGLPVGAGKTLITYLAPLLFGSKRPVLVAPAALKDKTFKDFRAYVGQWKTPRIIPRFVSRESLALEKNQHLLDRINPDLLLIDEADVLHNIETAAVKRIDRFRVEHREVPYGLFAGTWMRKKIEEVAHLFAWALLEGAPVPLTSGEVAEWGLSLNLQPDNKWGETFTPGAMGESQQVARAWLQKRILETPGVVIIDGDSCDQPLTIHVRPAKEDPKLDEHYRVFATEFENPRGIPVSDPLSRDRLDKQMGCGLCHYWDPEAPEEWMRKRRAFAALVRACIGSPYGAHLDTEAMVVNRYPGNPIVQEWLAIRGSFVPNVCTTWLSGSTLESVEEWLAEGSGPGIVWCGNVEFAHVLQKRTGLRYYANLGRDVSGSSIVHADQSRSVIVSWAANTRGLELQWSCRQLLVYPPSTAPRFEQIIGRSHRSKQDRPVHVTFLATSGLQVDNFRRMFAEAETAQAFLSLTQKILNAEIIEQEPPNTATNVYRWARRTE
jgi:hypothetical protein